MGHCRLTGNPRSVRETLKTQSALPFPFSSNMPNYTNPLVDEKNPLYCPAIPAATYRKELRFRTQKLAKAKNSSRGNLTRSFGYSLEQFFREGSKNDDSIGSDWILGDYFTSGQGWFSSQPSAAEELPPYSPMAVRAQAKVPQILDISSTSVVRHLKRKNDFSDFGAPPKYARSLPSAHDSSFDMELCWEKLQFTGVKLSPADTTKVLQQGSPAPKPDLDKLIDKLGSELSGIGLKERLRKLGIITPQSLMDFLCIHGKSHYLSFSFYTHAIQLTSTHGL